MTTLDDLHDVYCFRVIDLIKLLISNQQVGFINCVIEQDPGIADDEANCMGTDRQKDQCIREVADELKNLKRRKDGTFYEPRQKTAKETDNAIRTVR